MSLKDRGNELYNRWVGGENAIPVRFLAKMQRVMTKQAVPNDVVPTPLSDTVVESSIETGRIGERVLTQVQKVAGDVVLTGAQNYADRTLGTVTETMRTGAQSADAGLLVVESEVEDLGNGQTLRRTVAVASHPVLTGANWDDDLQTSRSFTEQYVAASYSPSSNQELEIVNVDKALLKTVTVPTSAYDSYMLTYPTQANLALPDVLEAVLIVWSEGKAEGGFDSDFGGTSTGSSTSLNGSSSGNASGTESAAPDLAINIKQIYGRNLPTETKFFYLHKDDLTLAEILTKCGATARWPVFKPVAHTIVLSGAKLSAEARVSAQGGYSNNPTTVTTEGNIGSGDSYDVSISARTVTIPPTIHAAITFSGDTVKSPSVSVTADAGFSGSGGFPTLSVAKTATKTLSSAAKVTPNSLTATTPAAIPTSGIYLIDSAVQPVKDGYVRVMAEIIDASIFA